MFTSLTAPPQTNLGVEQMRVHHSSFDVVHVSVVFESSLQKPRLLAQLCYMSAVVVREHLVPQDCICNLEMLEVHMNTQISFKITENLASG